MNKNQPFFRRDSCPFLSFSQFVLTVFIVTFNMTQSALLSYHPEFPSHIKQNWTTSIWVNRIGELASINFIRKWVGNLIWNAALSLCNLFKLIWDLLKFHQTSKILRKRVCGASVCASVHCISLVKLFQATYQLL